MATLPGPFHAGGAYIWPHTPPVLLDAVAALLRRWSRLDLTQASSLIAIASSAPATWRLLRGLLHSATAWVQRFFIASVVIPARDPLNNDVVCWVIAHVVEPRRNSRFFTARTGEAGRGGGGGNGGARFIGPIGPINAYVGGGGGGGGFFRGHQVVGGSSGGLPKRTHRAVQYCPHWRSLWFFWPGVAAAPGVLLSVSRVQENLAVMFAVDPSYDGVGGAELTISCLGRSAAPVRAFVEMCRVWAERRAQDCVVVYTRNRSGVGWQVRAWRPARHLDTVYFDEARKAVLLADVRQYLDPQALRRYRRRSMPYRRGYLFYGPPGTGKTSLTTALAGEFNLDLYEVQIPSVGSDADLEQMFRELPPQCIVLLEDIDAVWTGREQRSLPSRRVDDRLPSGENTRKEQQDTHASGSTQSNCTLSGLLNVLDGVGSQEGRIVVMTTNKPERLDSALVRPGRVDMRVFLGNISRASAERMFVRMFVPEESVEDVGEVEMRRIRTLAARFATVVPEDTFTPSQLQGFFQMHLDSAEEAADAIGEWVARECGNGKDRDFEFVGSHKRL